MLCVVMKVLSHASAKKKTKKVKSFKFRTFMVAFRRRQGSEGVKPYLDYTFLGGLLLSHLAVLQRSPL